MARFSCVSKLWLFILTRPRLLFVLEQVSGELLFFSSPHPQKNPYEKSSPVVAADFSHEVLSRHVARISWAFFGSETFKFVAAECFRDPQSTKLINYKGKLGGIDLTYDDSDAIEL
ncbi:hypothetical protein F2Q70_00013437, partial [Brassica cretica]